MAIKTRNGYSVLLAPLLTVLLLSACSGPGEDTPVDEPPSPGAATQGEHSGGIVFREHAITDPGMNDALIATLLIPEGWTVEGGATRPADILYNMPVLIDVTVTAPDGRVAHFFPSLSFEFNYQNPAQPLTPLQSGNLYYPLPESPGQWVMELAQNNPAPGISKLQLVSETDIPEITQALRQQQAQRFQHIAQLNQTTASMGFGSEFDTQATQVVLHYERNGTPIEETLVITWQYEIMITQGQVTQGVWGIQHMQSIGGPVGSNYLDDPALNAVFQSVRNNPAWTAEMNKYWRQLAQIKHKGNMEAIAAAGERSRIMAEASSDVNDIMMKGWRARNASSDNLQAQTVDNILDQTEYATPSGEAVKLPSFYENVHTDGDGRYILHNDAFYEPNRDPAFNNRDWQRIEPTR